jgi:hypothetical protein
VEIERLLGRIIDRVGVGDAACTMNGMHDR